MTPATYDKEAICREGQRIYDETLRSQVEGPFRGKFLVIDVLTRDYEIGDDDLEASTHMMARNPNAILYGVRIGSPAAYRFGMRIKDVPV